MDELICSEVSAVGNLEIHLSEKLALKRLYPAIDMSQVHVKQGQLLMSDKEEAFDRFLHDRYLSRFGAESLNELLSSSATYEQFIQKIRDAVEK